MELQSRPFPALSETEAVSSFLQKVFIWMTGGLVLTGAIAFQVSHSEGLMQILFGTPFLFTGLIIGELLIVLAMSLLVNKVSTALAGTMFVAYSALNGVTLSVIFLAYTAQSIGQVFFITAGMFGGMAAFGYLTKRDLTSMGSFMIMGLWGILLAMVVNFWLKSPALAYAVSIIGVFIFLGLTAYDMQKLKSFALSNTEYSQSSEKPAIYGALTLYLDFINLFLNMLRLFGKRR